MFAFVDNHHDFIFNVLPEFLHNKWVLTVFHIIFFAFVVKITNFFTLSLGYIFKQQALSPPA